jgi:hypothetical protein
MLDLKLMKKLVSDALARETAESLDAFLRQYPDYVPQAAKVGIEGFTGKAKNTLFETKGTSFQINNSQAKRLFMKCADNEVNVAVEDCPPYSNAA